MDAPPFTLNAWLRYDLIERTLAGLDGIESILEIGAGRGALGARLATRYRYVGVEPDELSCEAAKDVLGRLGSGEMVCGDVSALPRGRRLRRRLRLRGARAHRGRRGRPARLARAAAARRPPPHERPALPAPLRGRRPLRRALPPLRSRAARRAPARDRLRGRAPPDLRLPARARAREVAEPARARGEAGREPGGAHRRERPALSAFRPRGTGDAGAVGALPLRAAAVLRHAPRRGALRRRAP